MASELKGERHRVLILDEDPATASAVKEVVEELSAFSPVLEWASNVDDAFGILEEKEVALVISEMHLGEHDITYLIKTLKRYNPHVVTMVLTSFRDSAALVDLINEGQVHRFLPKPIRHRLMLKSINDALEHYTRLKTVPELARRHRVEESRNPVASAISNRIVSFVKRLRGGVAKQPA